MLGLGEHRTDLGSSQLKGGKDRYAQITETESGVLPEAASLEQGACRPLFYWHGVLPPLVARMFMLALNLKSSRFILRIARTVRATEPALSSCLLLPSAGVVC